MVLLNCQPDGALSTMVAVPVLKSLFSTSVMDMGLRVVKAGALPVAALLLQMFVPPVAAVIDTLATAVLTAQQTNHNTASSLLYIFSIPVNFCAEMLTKSHNVSRFPFARKTHHFTLLQI